MKIIGSTRDQKLAESLLQEITEKNIPVKLVLENGEDWTLYSLNHDDHLHEMAVDIYRIRLGLKKPLEIDPEWIKIKSVPLGFWTKIILLISIVLYVCSYIFKDVLYEILFFSKPEETMFFSSLVLEFEFWRIITPAFLHMGFLHILFNGLWFKDLGSVIEEYFSPKMFLMMFVILAFGSNILQYIFRGPQFGGLSGVLYGFLGFLFVRKKLHPTFEYGLPDRDLVIMLIWYVLCLVGVFGNIANFAHGGGLFLGVIYAYVLEKNVLEAIKSQWKIFLCNFLLLLSTILIEGFRLDFQFYFLKFLELSHYNL